MGFLYSCWVMFPSLNESHQSKSLASTFCLVEPVYSSGIPLLCMLCIGCSRMTLGKVHFMSMSRTPSSFPLHHASFADAMTLWRELVVVQPGLQLSWFIVTSWCFSAIFTKSSMLGCRGSAVVGLYVVD